MSSELYEKIENTEKRETLSGFNSYLKTFENDDDNISLIRKKLSFYSGYYLYEISNNHVMPPVARYLIVNEDKSDIHVIDYRNETIYALNKELKLDLNEENITEYIKFFFSFVRGKHGRFLILDTVDDIQWQEEPPLAARRAIASMILPVECLNMGHENAEAIYICQATMVFKDSLIRATIRVEENGHIHISDEEILVEDMPIIDDVLVV